MPAVLQYLFYPGIDAEFDVRMLLSLGRPASPPYLQRHPVDGQLGADLR